MLGSVRSLFENGAHSMVNADGTHSLQAQVFSALSAAALDHDPERSILLGMQAVNATLQHGEPSELAAQFALRQAISQSRLRLAIRYEDGAVPTCADWHPNGTSIVTGSTFGPVTAWAASTGEALWSNPFTNASTIAFSPDGTKIAVGGLLGTVAVLDAASGALLKSISNTQAFSVSFSPDGRRLAIQTLNSSGIWDVETAELLMALVDGTASNLAWSPDGLVIATCADGVRLWDAETGTMRKMLGPVRNVRCVTWSPDSASLAVALDSACEIWDTTAGLQRPDVGAFAVGGGIIAWSPDGALLAKRSGGTVTVYDAAQGNLSMTLRGHRQGDANPFLSWRRDGTRLATGAGQTGPLNYSYFHDGHFTMKHGTLNVKIWDLRAPGDPDGVEWSTLQLPTRIFDLAWSGDSGRIAVACEDACRIFDAEHGAEMFRFPAKLRDQSVDIAWSPDSAWLVAHELDYNGNNNITRLWLAAIGEELLTLPVVESVAVASLKNLSWSADGSRMAAIYDKQRVAVWDMKTRRLVSNPDTVIDASVPALSPDGTILATASGSAGAIQIWEVESGRLLKTLTTPNSLAPDGLVWLSDGKRLVAITSAAVTAWYVYGESELYTFANPPGFEAFEVSPDKKRLALLVLAGQQTSSGPVVQPGKNALLTLWDLESGQELPPPEFLDEYTHSVPPQVCWSPDAQHIATGWSATTGIFDGINGPSWGGIERFVRVADATTGKETFAVNSVPADNIAWRPDGKRIACCDHQRVRIYTTDAQELLALARSRITRNFTFDECQRYFHGDDPPPIP